MSRKTELKRRDFLGLGAAGLAALSAACAPAVTEMKPKAPEPQPGPPSPARSQTKRVLGRTGIEVPIVSMGVMNADNPNLVRAAYGGGMVLFDTAHGYQGGRNEEMLGTVFQGKKRESFVMCTKVSPGGLDRRTGRFADDTRGEELLEKLDISLKRLGMDHVDILYLHGQTAREGVLFAPVLKALEKAKKDGKTRFIGVSTHKNEPEVIRAAVESKLYDVVLTSYNFKQDHRAEVGKAIAEAAAAGLGVVAMKTQAGAYWDKQKTLPIDMRAALRWALSDPNVHTAIPGFTTLDQLELDLDVLHNPTLTDGDRKKLEPPPKVAGMFCQGCDKCIGPCPERLPIPDLMRGYMYASAYENRDAAERLLAELDLPQPVCGDCASCAVRCAKGFDVRERIRDVVRLRVG